MYVILTIRDATVHRSPSAALSLHAAPRHELSHSSHPLVSLRRLCDFHAAFTLEGRDNEELPERTLLAVRIRGLDLPHVAQEVELPEPASVEVS